MEMVHLCMPSDKNALERLPFIYGTVIDRRGQGEQQSEGGGI